MRVWTTLAAAVLAAGGIAACQPEKGGTIFLTNLDIPQREGVHDIVLHVTDPEHASYPIVIGIARPGSVSVVDFEPQVRGKCLDLDHATIEAPHSPADYEVVGDSCLSKTTKLTLRHKPHS